MFVFQRFTTLQDLDKQYRVSHEKEVDVFKLPQINFLGMHDTTLVTTTQTCC